MPDRAMPSCMYSFIACNRGALCLMQSCLSCVQLGSHTNRSLEQQRSTSPPGDVLECVLLPQGLQWMLNREQLGGASAREGVLRLDPRWVQLVAPSGATFYVERFNPWNVSATFVPAPVPTTCGGFLCDEVRCQPCCRSPCQSTHK